MVTETIVLNEKRNVVLKSYLRSANEEKNITKRPAVLVLPGGGYAYCSPNEAEPVAMAYAGAGYQAFVLQYSVAQYSTWPNPLEDYEQAMELIRSKNQEWNVYEDKIAVIGFSAGGHLASAAATMAKNRPNAAILGYAETLTESNDMGLWVPNTVEEVDEDTCPCFLFSSRMDGAVPVISSVKFMEALIKHDIGFETHIYAYGPHGFSVATAEVSSDLPQFCSRIPNWVCDSIGWLKDIFGDFCKDGMTKPHCPAKINGNHEPYLSADCTMGLLLEVPQASEILMKMQTMAMEQHPELLQKQEKMEKGGNISAEVSASIAQNMTFREAMGYAGIDAETLSYLDDQLRKIKNPHIK